jgi:hypothetical protein
MTDYNNTDRFLFYDSHAEVTVNRGKIHATVGICKLDCTELNKAINQLAEDDAKDYVQIMKDTRYSIHRSNWDGKMFDEGYRLPAHLKLFMGQLDECYSGMLQWYATVVCYSGMLQWYATVVQEGLRRTCNVSM